MSSHLFKLRYEPWRAGCHWVVYRRTRKWFKDRWEQDGLSYGTEGHAAQAVEHSLSLMRDALKVSPKATRYWDLTGEDWSSGW